MLDNKIKTLFCVNIENNKINDIHKNTALILSGCEVTLSEDIYSEMKEMNCYYLNNNDYGYDSFTIELYFENNLVNPYLQFYLSCISIRIDNSYICKINRNLSYKTSKNKFYTKINKDGKISIGLGYHFTSYEEYLILNNCKSFIIEGYLALEKKNNVFGFMCHVIKSHDNWLMYKGDTHKVYKKNNINNFIH